MALRSIKFWYFEAIYVHVVKNTMQPKLHIPHNGYEALFVT